MIGFKKISTFITALSLIIFTGIACSASDPAEKEADRLEDKADQVRKEDKENRKATEKVGEAIADKKEDDADRVRKNTKD